MINALKNLFREKVVSNSIEADEAIAYDMERSRELERERAIQSKIDAEAVFDRFCNASALVILLIILVLSVLSLALASMMIAGLVKIIGAVD